ncbi:MAG: hypothetical protein RR087_01760, partial [Oscillospiraceae bacterium]
MKGPSAAADENVTLGGDGTEATPYLISKAEDFKFLAQQSTAYFKLANDIDLSGISFSTINTDNGFLGQLDGDNRIIKNMTINAASGDAALISTLGNGTNNVRGRVINLVFENPVINAANGNAAVVACESKGIIKNVHIKGGNVTATGLAGGFTANCGDTSELIECSTTASIKGAVEVGGLSGHIDKGLVSMCFIGGSVGGAAPAQGAVTGKYFTLGGNSINVKNVYWNDAVGQIAAGTTDSNAEFANTVGEVATLPASVAVVVGSKIMIKAESTAELPLLSYKSSNDAVAQVSATGEITGKSVGKAKAQIFLGDTNVLLGETNVDVSAPAQIGGWVEENGNRYYIENGQKAKGWVQIAERWYHLSETTGEQLLGFQEKTSGNPEDKGFYCYDEKGELAEAGWHMINGSLRQVETNGRFTSGWATDKNGNRRYMSISGYKTVGWAEIEGKTYLFSEDGVCIGSTGWKEYRGKRYYFINDVLQKGWVKIAERWYHLSETTGEQLLGFQEKTSGNPEDKGFYCYDEKGELAEAGWHMINGSLRQVETNGRFTSGWATDKNGNRRYMSISGYKTVGWAEIEGKTYLFSEDGVCAQQSGGWINYQGKRYYFVNDVLQKGWVQIAERWYHLSETTGEQLLGFQEKTSGNPEDKGFYCYDEKGELAEAGWHMINGSLRQVETNGRFTSGWATDKNGNRRYMSISGYKTVGWAEIEGKTYLFSEDGVCIGSTGWKEYRGKRYYFINDVLQKGWVKIAERWYHLSETTGEQLLGFQEKTSGNPEDKGFYCYDEKGELAEAGWHMINGSLRQVETNGRFTSGWATDKNGNRRYMSISGYKTVGWNKIENRWYNFAEDGVQQKGWQYKTSGEEQAQYYYKDDGTLYPEGWHVMFNSKRYVNANGSMYSGWKVDDKGKRRYMTASGYKVMDWNKIENRWYDFDNDGVQLTGMLEKTTGEDKGWYFFKPDGTLHNHGFAYIEGVNRFVLKNGRLATGWQSWEGYQYYFKDKGIAVTDSQIIDGKQCYFTAEGKYIAPPTINNVLYTVYAKTATLNITATASPLTTIVAYSWDGGVTWINSASKEYPVGSTIPANT